MGNTSGFPPTQQRVAGSPIQGSATKAFHIASILRLSLRPMPSPGFIEPCLPMMSRTVPTGAGWAYEIKHDGFRFICRRRSAELVRQRFARDPGGLS